ncbi:Zn-dependent exopeptidase [Stereum hirsutum FP-91666 SS1]|uniref:Zn-dependent exopeptidase n=1 Tax=Stereum hirsutum (strain FP-91666) TaxID=721885 RepID=UPI0004410556|nr:Zn-dependent exopeptidase [Stereum hirsutum FP-91666 SS1]EIM89796.1 Zn-dependent exopeptidase [Stereum hirsutum FP-91666 SS1]
MDGEKAQLEKRLDFEEGGLRVSVLATPGLPLRITHTLARTEQPRSRVRRLLVFLALAGFVFHATTRVFKHAGDEVAFRGQSHGFVHQGKVEHGLHGKKAEELFLTIPNEASALSVARQYATKAHRAGSSGDLTTAKDFLSLLQTELSISQPASFPLFPAGTDASRNATLSIPTLTEPNAWIDVYYPIMNTPLDRSLQILGEDGETVEWSAELEEVPDEEDRDAWEARDEVPAFHGFSGGGEVEGKLVYVNYGTKADYDALVEKGVNLTGAIAIARYGANLRGLKIKGAEELGAVGCLIYSDPRDDGSVIVENGYKAYPYGPARNPNSVQRGSVQYVQLYPGDPTTPGYPAYENSTRTDGENIPLIPSIPISWANAKVLLKEIEEGGPNRTVKLVNHVNNTVMPIWNTMGVIPGHLTDEVIVVGNHRDAWVLGAVDPTSGTASVAEIIRGFGVLLKAGWKPTRTIVFASWDAEEYGLVGSTEWGEDFKDWIDEHVVAYLNLDVSVGGSRFEAQGSPSLAHFVRSTAQEITHPTDPTRTLWDARTDNGPYYQPGDDLVHAQADERMRTAEGSIGVGYLGSGSDFTVFLQHIGVASTNYGFGGGPGDAVYHYHSIFDSVRWLELYGDPGFTRHVAIAKHLGLQVLRMADSTILPFNTTHYAFELEAQLEKVELLADEFAVTVDFAPLRSAIHGLQLASIELDKAKVKAEARLDHLVGRWRRRVARKHWLKKVWRKIKGIFTGHRDEYEGKGLLAGHSCAEMHAGGNHGPDIVHAHERENHGGAMLKYHAHKHRRGPGRKFMKAAREVQKINHKLASFERGFIVEDGFVGREWYKNIAIAPGKWLGYGATPLPALTEAITIEGNATLATAEADRLQQAVALIAKSLQV